ncbi:MAG: type II secretion system secretin GspD [Pseudomonadota bacterium]
MLLAVLAFMGLGAHTVRAQEERLERINYSNTEMQSFIESIAKDTGKTFIVDPSVRGNVTITSQVLLTRDEIFQIFLSTMRVYGYSVVLTSSGAYKIIPNQAASQSASAIGPDAVEGDQFVTEVVKLNNFEASAAVGMIKPIVDRQGHVAANPRVNAVVIADYASNMGRIRQVLRELDRDNSVIETIALKNTSAQEMARIASSLGGRGASEDGRGGGNISFVAVDSSNSLVIRGDSVSVSRMRRIVEDLDRRGESSQNTSVIYLKYADAEELAPILEDLSGALTLPGGGGDGGAVVTAARPGGPNIAFHKPTNALIINADPDTQRALSDIVRQLDIRRAQVLVEAIIVEVTDDTARELGLEFIMSGSDESDLPFVLSDYSRSNPNLLALTGALLLGDREENGDGDSSTGSGVTDQLQEAAVNSLLNLNGFTAGFGGRTGDGTLFGVILNAVDNDASSNVLSTPSLMTLDNEPASIIVGQEIPVTTGESLGTDNQNPFRTTQRQDVGVQLEVTPQINEGDAIRLFIRQEVSNVSPSVVNDATDFILDKREIQTTVLADDGEIIVLGGLIEDEETITQSKVPVLGELPVLGRLFSSEGRVVDKTNLMVFLRPTIVRDKDDIRAVTNRKYNFMQAEIIERMPDGAPRLDNFLREVVGDAPTVESSAGAER